MKAFIVYWHPEPKSFNFALYNTACDVFIESGYEIKQSNLFEMNFNPVSGRHNFVTQKDPDYFKQQIEEMHASENESFSNFQILYEE